MAPSRQQLGPSRPAAAGPEPAASAPMATSAHGDGVGPALSVDSITVQSDRLVLRVSLAPDAPRFMDDRLAAQLDALRPSLKAHACVNGVGPTFGAVMATTAIPHVLEHLILDEQVRADTAPDTAPFSGITIWLDEAAGLAHVEVSYFDDLTALEAVQAAAACLNDLLRR